MPDARRSPPSCPPRRHPASGLVPRVRPGTVVVGGPLRILAVADWSRLGGLERTCRDAAGAGATVQAAPDVLVAARLAASWRPHAIVLDDRLPGALGLPAALDAVLPRTCTILVADHPRPPRDGLLVQPRPLVARRLAPMLARVAAVQGMRTPRAA